MKKKINKKNVPAYAFGMDQLPNYLGGANVLGSAISGLSGEGSTGDAIGSTLGSAASLAGAGFSIGGPIGAAAGGVLGTAFGPFSRHFNQFSTNSKSAILLGPFRGGSSRFSLPETPKQGFEEEVGMGYYL